MKRHVALVGFMASGKSTIGRKLARKLGWTFFDTDALIARAHGAIAAIFANEGEMAFRGYERAAIDNALQSVEPSVLSVGGGALTVAENRRALNDRAYCVFIRVSPEEILARARRSRTIRPLLGSNPTLERIKELYAARMPDYENADHTIDATHRSDGQVVDEIVDWLRQLKLDAGRVAS